MADQLTMLENRLDDLYTVSATYIADSTVVVNWDDYNHRAGFLKAIRKVGEMIKEVRNPETPQETGEIPSVLEG